MAKQFQHVRIVGGDSKTTISKRQLSFESMQEDKRNNEDKILSLFVFKPRQTGFSAVAEMTAAAINNPTSTAILAVAPDDESVDEHIDRESLLDILRTQSDAPVFEDEDHLVDYIDDVVEDTQADALSIVK